MRYLTLAAAAAISLIFTGAVFPNINIYGVAPDVIICTAVSIAILEKSMTGAGLALVCGLFLDVLFSGAIGLYSIPYLVAGAVVYFVMQYVNYLDKYLLPALFAIGAYIVKELATALVVYMIGDSFAFGHMLVRFILPSALSTGLLMLLIHLIFRRIYRSPSMKARRGEDFKRL